MKRILTLTLLAIICSVCHAATPYLACEKIFEREDLRSEGHDVVFINQPNNFFRCVTAENDKSLQADIKKAFEQDRTKSFSSMEGFDSVNKCDYSILSIKRNGYVISVGFFHNKEGYVNLFIQADPAAFK